MKVFLKQTENNDIWRLWPACKVSHGHCERKGSFAFPDDPFITIEYFRNAGYDVELETPNHVFKYKAYEVLHAS